MRPTSSSSVARPETLVSIGLYFFAGSLFILALALYKNGDGALSSLWTGRFRGFGWLGTLSALLGAALVFAAYRWSRLSRASGFWLPLALNLIVVVFCLGTAEIALRILATPGPYGPRIGSITLLPYEWEKAVETNLEYVKKSLGGKSYFVEHETLGWTVGASRTSADRMYKSSAEGIRSAEQGVSFAASDPRRRIAFLGNSYAFAEEVPFEDSWGYFLERSLPAGSRVLNFGVPGYGVDQAWLRFRQDVVKWNPTITVFAFVQDDIWRTGNAYPFFKEWFGPSKPRFVIEGDKLKALNSPALPADRIFAHRSVHELPFLEYDNQFVPDEWATSPVYASYLARFLVTKFPRWQSPSALTSEATIASLGSRIIEEFYASAQASGTHPFIVYLPSKYDFRSTTNYARETVLASLKQKDIPVTDLTPCLLQRVSKEQLFLVQGLHYSRQGNAAAAECVRALIADKLTAP